MNRTKRVEKVTQGKFVKLYDLTYEDKNGVERKWTFASRKEKTLPETGEITTDAVVVVPLYLSDDGKPKFVVTKEYRPPLGGYEYAVPAGLVDEGESVTDTAVRELKEETGLDVTKIHFVTPPLFSSAGMTDEATSIVFVECRGEPSTEGNEDAEDIEVLLIPMVDMARYILGQEDIFPDGRLSAKAYLAWLYMMTSGREMILEES